MSSEDELAALLGHEIAHVTARHSREYRNRQLLGKSVGFVSALATGVGDLMGVTNTATVQELLKFKVEQELEADRLGGEYMAKAGYNPLAIIELVQTLKESDTFARQVEKQPAVYHGLYRTHPKNDKRLHETVGCAQAYYAANRRTLQILGTVDAGLRDETSTASSGTTTSPRRPACPWWSFDDWTVDSRRPKSAQPQAAPRGGAHHPAPDNAIARLPP